MTNVLNLLSESTYIEKMDTQNALLKALVTQGGGDYVPVGIDSWAAVQRIVRLGIASKVFSIGDQLVCNHETYGPLVWDIIGIDHDTPTNPEFEHSITLQLHDCINDAVLPFDVAEPTNPDSNRRYYGSNNWLESNIRQWLNSDGNVGAWWEAKTEYDAMPSYANSTAGFLRGIDEGFLATVGEVFKITARNTVTDGGGSDTSVETFFLLSPREVDGSKLNNDIKEGSLYPYYGAGTNLCRIKFRNGVAQNWWLRSPYSATSHRTNDVYLTGAVSGASTSDILGIAPAVCIV